jgi:hypothetical protein
MKLKNLNKRIQRLVDRIAKDTKKLVKLRRKQAAASKPSAKKRSRPRQKVVPNPKKESAPKKKKRQLSPEARAKLSARMKERWEAKRAASSLSPPIGADAAAVAGFPS